MVDIHIVTTLLGGQLATFRVCNDTGDNLVTVLLMTDGSSTPFFAVCSFCIHCVINVSPTQGHTILVLSTTFWHS
jgi:hypothetical protein